MRRSLGSARRLLVARRLHTRHEPGAISMETAVLEYAVDEEAGVLDIQHTRTPPEMRGQGVAEKLCDAAFEHARGASLRVLPSCSYVSDRYLPKHSEAQGIAVRSVDSATPGLCICVSWLGVASLRLVDARRRNPLTAALLAKLQSFLGACAAMEVTHGGPLPEVRTLLLESTGPVFSSGHDFNDFHEAPAAEQRRVLEMCADVNALLAEVPQVSVAAVSGACVAGGAQLAASCDLVIARDDARFCLPGVRTGGFCHTPAVAVGARVAPRKALELALLASDVDAVEAERIGLANSVVPSAEWASAVEQTVNQLARTFSKSVADGKRTFYRQAAAPALRDRYVVATDTMVDMFSSPAYQESMAAFLRRKE